MAFKRKSLDESDMQIWARHDCSYGFFSVIEEEIDAGIRALIKDPSHENAEKVKAFQKVLGLIEEARNPK